MPGIYSMDLIQSIKKHENFSARPYPDPLSGGDPWTFGYGFTFLTIEEANAVLNLRIRRITTELDMRIVFFVQLPADARAVLIEMAYQLGVNGVLNFKRMIESLKARDFEHAATEMLDSKWARQTPGRAQELASVMRSAGNGK